MSRNKLELRLAPVIRSGGALPNNGGNYEPKQTRIGFRDSRHIGECIVGRDRTSELVIIEFQRQASAGLETVRVVGTQQNARKPQTGNRRLNNPRNRRPVAERIS
jgi:hypothetical protein